MKDLTFSLFADEMNDDAQFIPINIDADDADNTKLEIPEIIPILPLRNTVLFPGIITPISLGRAKSIQLIKDIQKSKGLFGTLSQKDATVEDPKSDELYHIGTIAKVIKVLEMPDNTTTVIIQGKKRFQLIEVTEFEPYLKGRIETLLEITPENDVNREFEAIISSIRDLSMRLIKNSGQFPPESSFAVKNIDNFSFLINFISSNIEIDVLDKQKLLEIEELKERGRALVEHLVKEVQLLEIKTDIQSKVKVDIDQQQREYLLQQQIKTIQNELGNNPVEQEVNEFKAKAENKKWTKEVAEIFEKELNKLQRLNPAAGEYSVQINYLQNFIDLPWNEYTEDNFDINKAENQLDKDHYGLEKVKERILEHLAVLKLKGDLKSPIICLHGPPGVGKTSLGKSIAEALGRKFIRISLGGLHDEAEIRGHRKTYIGAMPGRIMIGLKKAGSSNPVFVLDEIDKIGSSAHGDPASALLEVLDPEQNRAFHDNFLDVDYDLSKVMFIATANNLSNIASPLLDRMELIDVSGYVLDEKIEIAKRHLLPKQLENHGIEANKISISKAVFSTIIEGYTRESGVRTLDKTIAKLCRKLALKLAKDGEIKKTISNSDITDYLGIAQYSKTKYSDNSIPGIVTGLAWTAVGGDILFVESSISKGKGKLTLTGNLGEVMKESAILAMEYIRSHSDELNIVIDEIDNHNVHIHVPEGAIPKDGPSAGVTMLTSLVSTFTQRKVKSKISMTGEITLRGKVLAVGGIKEKILAAKRAGITEIILSEENRKDISEINSNYLEGLTFHFVKHVDEVLKYALI